MESPITRTFPFGRICIFCSSWIESRFINRERIPKYNWRAAWRPPCNVSVSVHFTRDHSGPIESEQSDKWATDQFWPKGRLGRIGPPISGSGRYFPRYNHGPELRKVTKRQFQQELMLEEYFDHHLVSVLEVFQNHSLLELEIFPIGPYLYLWKFYQEQPARSIWNAKYKHLHLWIIQPTHLIYLVMWKFLG